MRFIAKVFLIIVLNAGLFWALETKIFPDTFSVTSGIEGYFFIAIIFTLLNIILRPIITLITIPFRILTLGVIGFFVNAFMLWILENSVNFLELFNTQIEISGFSTYLIAGVILSLLNSIFNWLRS